MTLLEVLVVLFIIGALLALLFPAVQAARSRARSEVCQNNLRQLGLAMNNYTQTQDQIPELNRWTIAVFSWIEERPLADDISSLGAAELKPQRPALFGCPSQADVDINRDESAPCHYVFTIYTVRSRIEPRSERQRTRWVRIHDRELLTEAQSYEPWYIGSELVHPADEQLFENGHGPHAPGLFYAVSAGLDVNVFPRSR